MRQRGPRFAVVGHVEWVTFARVPHIPRSGDIVHAHDAFEEPAGGGAVAAVQLARLDGGALLITALGDDEIAERALVRLRDLGVEVRAITRPGTPTRSALTLVDDRGERTITTVGERLEPRGADALGWDELARMDGVYFTAGDTAALRSARAARVLVASPRADDALGNGVQLDALTLSGNDDGERKAATPVEGEAELVAFTEGDRGGCFCTRGGATGRWRAITPPAGDNHSSAGDSYGAGDSFAAGLTFAFGERLDVEQALALGARCGAWCVSGRGPYGHQLTARELRTAET